MGDDFERDIAVREMPAVGMRPHLAVGEFAHLFADRLERIVEAMIDERTAPHQLDEPRAIFRVVAVREQLLDPERDARGHLRAGEAEIGGSHDLALADRNAADRNRFAHQIAGCARGGGDDGALPLHQPVEQTRFSNIRASNDCQGQAFMNDLAIRKRCGQRVQRRTNRGDLLQNLFAGKH